eukprot:1537948-Rhodomonas_salina.1
MSAGLRGELPDLPTRCSAMSGTAIAYGAPLVLRQDMALTISSYASTMRWPVLKQRMACC